MNFFALTTSFVPAFFLLEVFGMLQFDLILFRVHSCIQTDDWFWFSDDASRVHFLAARQLLYSSEEMENCF